MWDAVCRPHSPAHCFICLDDRQYVPETGQAWTTHEALAAQHRVAIKPLGEHLVELQMAPSFAIGQRALLVMTPQGNVLWDCFALLDQPTIDFIRAQGGLRALALSHPHYYTTMNHWAAVFDCPILLHERDEPWLFNRGPRVELWRGDELPLWEGMRLHRIGGHFPGSSILHVPFLSAEGAVLCGDTFYLSPSKQHLAVMHSYPNRIPLPSREVARIGQRMQPLAFDALYGFYDFQNVSTGAKQLLETSLTRYEA